MLQELGYLKVVCLSDIMYHSVLLWNEIAVDWLSVAMQFGTYSCLDARMWTHGLVRPLFVAKTTWFGIPNFCNGKQEWVRHSVEDHEVRDENDVQVGFRLMEEPVQGIKQPLPKAVCQLGCVGWLGQGRIMIIKVSVIITDVFVGSRMQRCWFGLTGLYQYFL